MNRKIVIPCISRGDCAGLEALQSLGQDSMHMFSDGTNLLHYAVKWCKVDICRLLLIHGAVVRGVVVDGQDCLLLAIHLGYREIVELFIEYDCISATPSIDILQQCVHRDDSNLLARFLGLFQEKIENLSILLSQSLLLHGMSLQHLAAKNQSLRMTQIQLEYNAPVNGINPDGYTPLLYAVEQGNLCLVHYLLLNHACARVKTRMQDNIFHCAARATNVVYYIAQYVRNAYPADYSYMLHAYNIHQNTPQHIAIQSGRIDTVKMLLCNNFNVAYIENNRHVKNNTKCGCVAYRSFLCSAIATRNLSIVQEIVDAQVHMQGTCNDNREIILESVKTAQNNTYMDPDTTGHSSSDNTDHIVHQPNYQVTRTGAIRIHNLASSVNMHKTGNNDSNQEDEEDYQRRQQGSPRILCNNANDAFTAILKTGASPQFSISCLQLILDRGYTLENETCTLHTRIQAAIRANNSTILRFLQIYPPINLKSKQYQFLLYDAVQAECSGEIIQQLVSYGANVNVQTVTGESPLSAAVRLHNHPLVDLLLTLQADVNVFVSPMLANSQDMPISLLTLAILLNAKQNALHAQNAELVIRALLNHGANLHQLDGYGMSPIMHAVQQPSADNLETILQWLMHA